MKAKIPPFTFPFTLFTLLFAFYTLLNYLIGLIVIVVGALLVIKANWFVANFGSIDWAERHLGAEGGTRLFYKLLGIFVILGTFLALTGALGGILRGIFSFASF